MLAGALPAKGGGQIAVFRTPVFVFLLFCLAVSLTTCSARRLRPSSIGFLLAHLGCVLVLAGAFCGFVLGRKTQFGAPIAAEHAISELPAADNTTIKLPFSITVTDFSVDFYPPVYHLYTPPRRAAGENQGDENLQYRYVKPVNLSPDGTVRLPESPSLNIDDLKDDAGNWIRQVVLPNGNLLQMSEPAPKHYQATMKVVQTDGKTKTQILEVNKPITFRGWRFYLMSYDRQAQTYVVLSARKDPGRHAVIAGIWAIILGVAWLCWRRHPETQPTPLHPQSSTAVSL